MKDITPSVPLWFNNLIDGSLSLFLIWYGYWITGIFYFIHVLIQDELFKIGEKKE